MSGRRSSSLLRDGMAYEHTLAAGRNGRLPNAAPPASLGCGQPARPRGTGWRGPATAVQRRPGHGAECGVHSLWIRLLIRMWGREVNTQ